MLNTTKITAHNLQFNLLLPARSHNYTASLSMAYFTRFQNTIINDISIHIDHGFHILKSAILAF